MEVGGWRVEGKQLKVKELVAKATAKVAAATVAAMEEIVQAVVVGMGAVRQWGGRRRRSG